MTKPDYLNLDFPPAPAERPYTVVNMVMSADGKVVIEGTERGLGSAVDQRLMRELRVHADIVLNGAGTLRASGTSSRIDVEDLERVRRERGKAPAPIAAVLSRSGDLPLQRAFFRRRDFEAIVYLSESAPAERRAAIAASGRPVQSLPAGEEAPAMLRHMRQDLGAQLLLVEGGPALNGELLRRGLVDEYFLTLSPAIVGGRGGLTAVEGPAISTATEVRRLALLSATPNPESGEVYLRYRWSRS